MTTTSDLQTRDKQSVEREGMRPGSVFRPDVDIVERPEEFFVTADLPGVDEGCVAVKLEGGMLSIDAELATRPDPAWTPVHAEYRLGSYHRKFQLSDQIDVARIEARMRNGVLELHLPKSERHRRRQIEVHAG